MSKYRLLAILMICLFWFSSTGFQPNPQNITASSFTVTPSSEAPVALAAATFGKIYPGNKATGIPATSLTLQWNAVTGYTGTVTYGYCLTTKNKCNKYTRVGAALSKTVTGLQPNRTYYWWVRAYNSKGAVIAQADGGSWSFTTMGLPGAFNKSTPTGGSTDLSPSTLKLTWGTSSGATSYQYCVDTTNNNVCDAPSSGTSTGWLTGISGVTPPGLLNSRVYYWQVRAVNGGGTTLANGGTWWQFSTIVSTSGFTKITPSANAAGQLINGLTLSWGLSQNATGYQYCVSATSGSCPGGWTTLGNVTNATVNGLQYSTDYYWQVNALNSGSSTPADGGAWWKFTTQDPLPGAFNKLAPADLAANLYTDVTFTWQPSSGADYYEICIVTLAPDPTCGDSPWDIVTGTSYPVPGLDVGTQYYWQVRAVNATGTVESNNGTWYSFTTQPNPPIDFIKAAPQDGSTKTDTSLTLSWDPSPTTGVIYQICYDTTDDGSCDQDNWRAVPLGTVYDLTGLPLGTTYYWQVRATNIGGTTYADGDMQAWWSFTTIQPAPKAFAKSSPSDGAVDRSLNLSLAWTASDSDVTYQYCLSASASCPSEQDWVTTAGTSASLANLQPATTYYWQVRAGNSEGTITEANNGWWSFTTVPNPPSGFAKIDPLNFKTKAPVNLNLTWNPSATAGVSYEICYDQSDDDACDQENWRAVTSGSSYPLTGLDYGTTYYWQVRATNPGGATYADSGTTGWWSFTTMLPAPTAFGKSSPEKGANGQPVNLTVQWSASDPDVTYEVCYDTMDDNSCDQDAWHPANQGTSLSLTGLSYDTTYYWQVRAANSEGTITKADAGEWWSFRTVQSPPAAFDKAAPEDLSTKTVVNLSLTWTPSSTPGASYEICYDQSEDDACDEENWRPVSSGAEFALTGLDYGATYYWQARATNAGGTTYANGSPKAWWSFTTMLPAPKSFNKSSPLDNAGSEPIDLTLEWGTSDPGVTYQYCVSQNKGTCPSEQDWVTADGASAILANLTYDTTYSWQVRAVNSEGTVIEANDGAWWTFTTYSQPPTDFVKISPANNAPNQPLTVTLRWSSAGEGFTYEYCYGQSLPLSCGASWPSVSATSVEFSGLTNSTTYYWQVRAKDSSGHTTDANGLDTNPIWQFSTRPAPPSSSDKTILNLQEDHAVSDSLQGADTANWEFKLYGSAPAGSLNLQPSGHFTYTPPQDYFGDITFRFTVSDGINDPSIPYTVILHFENVNDGPVLDPIAVSNTQLSGQTILFTAAATDVDLSTGEHLTFSITNAPAGATIDETTGIFSWTPIWSKDGPNTYRFTITVSDGELTDTQEISVTILPRMIFQPIVFH